MNNCIFTTVDRNYEDHPVILVYYNDISDEFKSFVSDKKNFILAKYTNDNEYEEGFNLGPVGNEIVYLRYMLWTSVFDEYDDVLHLDVDTLVLGSLDNLFGRNTFTMIDNNEILPNVDILPRTEEAMHKVNEYLNNRSYDVFNPPKFGNAGVFVIPKNLRNFSNYESLVSITKSLSDILIYADQSAINLWMIEKDIQLSSEIEYNFQPHFFNYSGNEYDLDDVKILHFAAKKADSIQFSLWWRMKNLGTDFYSLYKKYLEMK